MGTARREEICDAALDLAAEGGNRAVTHHAIDDKLGLSRGSTSYYYRTRQQLLTAAIEHLTLASRSAFREALGTEPPPGALVDAAADLIARQVDKLLADRRRDVLARYALAADAARDDALRAALARCLFSLPEAESLTVALGADDSAGAAQDLLSLLEGLLFDRIYGTRSLEGIEAGTGASFTDLRSPVVRLLREISSP